MKQVHLTLQGKGGIGKSLVASLTAQYLLSKGEPVSIIDADPVTSTLSDYEALGAERMELLDGLVLLENRYDPLFGRTIEEDRSFVIDNGPSSYLTLANYLVENDAIKMIVNSGKQVFLHVVITGGQSLLDTAGEFYKLARVFPESVRFVVWLNPYWGPIESNGDCFTEFKVYKNNVDRIAGIVALPVSDNQTTYGRDMDDMLKKKLTFNEIEESSDFGQLAKHRLRQTKSRVYEQLGAII